jgi:DNA-binding protein YbaB
MDSNDWLLRDMEQRIDDQIRRSEQLRNELSALRITVESPGGQIAVTVDSAGSLVDLHLTDQALRPGPTELAGLILSTTRTAQARLAERIAELTGRVYGAGTETADFISTAYARQFPAPPADPQEVPR